MAGVDPVAEGPHQVGLAAARLAQQQQDPRRWRARRCSLIAVHDPVEPVRAAAWIDSTSNGSAFQTSVP